MSPKKNIHKILIPQKIFIFLKTQKNIEIQKKEKPGIEPATPGLKDIGLSPTPRR